MATIRSYVDEAGTTVFTNEKTFQQDSAQPTAGKLRASSGASPTILSTATSNSNLGLPVSQEIINNLDTQLRAVISNSGDDYLKLAQGLATIDGYIEAKKSDFFKAAQEQSHAQFGVQAFAQAVEENIKLDRASPEYAKYGMSDSDETLAARKRLGEVINAADSAVKEKLIANPSYLALEAYAKTYKSTAEKMVDKTFTRQETLRQNAELQFASYTPQEKNMINLALGNETKDPMMAITRIARMPDQSKKELDEVIRGGTSGLPALATAGNNVALSALVNTEKARTGASDEQVLTSLAPVMKIANDNTFALSAYEKLGEELRGNLTSDERKKVMKEDRDILAGKVKNPQAAASLRQSLALRVATELTMEKLNGNILSNGSSLPKPAFLEIASQDPKYNSGKISRDDAIALANLAPTVEARQKNIKDLVAYYKSAVDNQSKSLIFTPSPLALEGFHARAVNAGVLGDLKDYVSGMSVSNVIPNIGSALNTLDNQFAKVERAVNAPIADFLYGDASAYRKGK